MPWRHPRRHPSPIAVGVLATAVGASLLAAPAHARPSAAPATEGAPAPAVPVERQTLPAGDGWASLDGGTTGGADAPADRVIDVRTRDELVAAVAGDEPKIVRVVADIDANTRADGTRIACEEYARDGYSLDAYLAAYDPAVWSGPAKGALEDARKASQAAQRAQIEARIGSNTTVIGVGDVALTGFTFQVSGVDDVIIRNLRISDAYDCFPTWNGETWKTEWDNLVVSGSTHVWLDHLTLDDGDTVDADQPVYFGERFLRHDGLLDVVRAADLVTISWSRMQGHDKSLLWGNGDDRITDRGALRVTLHHNELVDLNQRAPRVRFGQAHVYDNTYRVTDPGHYIYSWGVGVESSIIARENTFELAEGVNPDRIIGHFGGTGIDAAGTWVNGAEVDVLAAYNAANPDLPLAGTVIGTAGPHGPIQPAEVAARAVAEGAGSGVLETWRDPLDPAHAGADLLAAIGAPADATADGPVWAPTATGFASLPSPDRPQGTTGGAGGATVTVRTADELARHAAARHPLVILVEGAIDVPFGEMIEVADDKTIAGADADAALVGGGLLLRGSSNVIVRNFSFRDSYVPGDWDGKTRENDNDGIRMDAATHVWIDHNDFARLGDGLVDVRKGSTAVTLSWNTFSDHNKTVGIGWSEEVATEITLHHNRFSNTYQRNASIGGASAAHVYNNHLEGTGSYGMLAREGSQVVVEQSYFENGEDPIVAYGDGSAVDSRDNVFTGTRGRRDDTGATFEPADRYAYRPDPAREIPAILAAHAGSLGDEDAVGDSVTVALDGTGDFASVSAAVGAAARADHPVEVVVQPGVYREVVRIWPDADGLTIRGATGIAEDVVITYDLAAGQQKFYGGTQGHTGSPTVSAMADDVTLADLTIENAYDEAAKGQSQALALRTVGDRTVLDGVRLLGNQDTFLADTPHIAQTSRVYVTDSYIEGDVDFIYGRATAVFEDSRIHSLDRGQTVNGYVAAPSTAAGVAGFLFQGSRFTSDAAAGTVFLGRPWHPSSNPDVDPSMVVRNSRLGAHISTPAWTDMSGWRWQDDRFAEYRNRGDGAAVAGAEGRPQLTKEQARAHTREAYLQGDDGWSPWL